MHAGREGGVLCMDVGFLCALKCTTVQEKNNTRESEVAKMEKLVTFVKEPLLEKEAQTIAAM